MIDLISNAFIGCDTPFEAADTVLFGAPFDGTTSFRPGTRFGPVALRAESDGIETYSPYLDGDLEDLAICDSGDLVFPFGNVERVLQMIEDRAAAILAAGKRPTMIGGEHLVTLGAFRAALAAYPDIHVIHLDAHADLRSEYLGEPLSHATVMRRIHDLVGDGRIHQFGIRSGDRSEWTFAREGHTDFHPFTLVAMAAVVQAIGDAPVYVTIDLDVFDPSLFAGTGTPEAGGILWQAMAAAMTCLAKANIVASDINELSPHYDPSGVSTAVAAKTLRELLIAQAR